MSRGLELRLMLCPNRLLNPDTDGIVRALTRQGIGTIVISSIVNFVWSIIAAKRGSDKLCHTLVRCHNDPSGSQIATYASFSIGSQ